MHSNKREKFMSFFSRAIYSFSQQDLPFFAKRKLSFIVPTAIAMMASTSTLAQSENPNLYSNFNSPSNPTNDWLNNQNINEKSQIDWSIIATAHSPVQPITAFIGDWDAPLESGDHAYLQGRADLKVRPAGSLISYGLGWRYDYLMSFSEETAEVYWQYENKQPSSTSQSYPLFLDAKHNERFGANVGFTQPLNSNWQLTTHANIWQGLHALEGKVSGDLTTRGLPDSEVSNIRDSVNKADAYVDYYYDKPALGEENLNWNPTKPSGYGYSLDLQLVGKLSDKTQVIISGYDVLGRMHWKDMPNTRYTLDYDVNGRPLYTIEGQLDTKDVTQTLPWRVEGSLMHQLNNQWQLGAHGQINDIQDLYQLSVGYQFANFHYPVAITGLIEPQTKALGITLDSKYGGIKLLTDDIDAEKAKRSEISLYGRYAW
ncbi:hypothetical protein [Psychrobacter sp. UBA5136]|uniref:hypothetical protein n=1 Tax=Psychrobacter sp. UBA5136 TaxID=1947356 RepID=UPI0025D301A7|nr:hypothetical protein [Psychrobacter sp. UBA5136]